MRQGRAAAGFTRWIAAAALIAKLWLQGAVAKMTRQQGTAAKKFTSVPYSNFILRQCACKDPARSAEF